MNTLFRCRIAFRLFTFDQPSMSQVDEVRAASEIVKVVGDYVKLRKAGANMMGLCPFHQEKTPSFAVHPGKQIFHCFGCGIGGDVFKFIMLIENITFPEALRLLAEKAGIALRESASDATYDASAKERTVLQKIHDWAAKFYASQLGSTAEGRAARAYLADRGLTDEVVARFRLGYAPAEGKALTARLADAGFAPEMAEKSGLVLRDQESNRRYDRFRRRIIFPIQNESGKVVAFGARALGEDQPKYMNSPETPIYSKSRVLYHLDRAGSEIRKLDYAILVEGYMDCIAVASCGIENVVASCGTSLTESQIRLLGRFAKRVVVNYDPDSAGTAATERSLTLLLEEGFEAKVLALPGGLDPDSFIRKHGAPKYRERLSSSPSYLDYLTDRASIKHDLSQPEGKVAAANAVLPYLARVPSPMLRAELGNRVAERLHLDERLLRDELRRAAGAGRREIQAPAALPVSKATPAERQLLKVFLENEDLAFEFLPNLIKEGDIAGLATENLFKQILSARSRGEKFDPCQLDESLNPDERRLVYELLMSPGGARDRAQVQGCANALRRRRLERESEQLQAAIRAAEREKNSALLGKLLEAKGDLTRQLVKLRGV
ncbi:MAG TPA: DNA primase [Terriglobia bacterium]|nr:DNA primase [Terriglobia bacterium]